MSSDLVRFAVKHTTPISDADVYVDDTVEENSFSKGMRPVKVCTNKILQFLTGGAGYRRLLLL